MGWSLFLHSGEISRCWCRKRSSMAAVLVQDPIIPILLWFLDFIPLKYSIKCLFYLCLLIFTQTIFVTLRSFYIDFSIACVLVQNCWDFYVFVHMCHCVPSMGFKEVWQADVNWQDLLVSLSQRLNGSNSKPSSNFPATFVRNCFSCQLTDRPWCSTRLIKGDQISCTNIPQMKLFSKVKWQPRVKPLLSYKTLSVLDNTHHIHYTY